MTEIIRFAPHSQSGGWPVLQVWRENEYGEGAYCWVRTPADFAGLTPAEHEAIEMLAR